MMALDLAATMDAVAAQLVAAGVTGRAYAWPVPEVSPPCAIVGFPADVPFDLTFGGYHELTIPVFLLVGVAADRETRAAMSAAISGAADVKTALDGSLSGTVQDARVSSAKVTVVPVGLVDWLTLEYALEVIA